MTQATHLEALNQKHATLDQIISEESRRPQPDQLRIAELKRRKLRLKEEMQRFRPN